MIDIPQRDFDLDEVKQQSAILVINSVDFVYRIFAVQVRDGFVPGVATDNLPDRFQVVSERDVKMDGKRLITDYITWFSMSPTAGKFDNKFINAIEAQPERKNALNEIVNKPVHELDFADIAVQHDWIRDRMHRQKEFRDDWLLHNEGGVIEVNGERFIVSDNVWDSEGMDGFSTQVRKVLDDLDIDRDVRETISRQRRMRRLLRMAGMRPAPILNTSISGRKRPILDRIGDGTQIS